MILATLAFGEKKCYAPPGMIWNFSIVTMYRNNIIISMIATSNALSVFVLDVFQFEQGSKNDLKCPRVA